MTARAIALRSAAIGATVVLSAGHAGADDARQWIEVGPQGTQVLREVVPGPTPKGVTRRSAGDGPGVLWTTNLSDAIYTTTGITVPEDGVAAGTWLNAPRQAQFSALAGAGVPIWTVPLNEVEAAASRNGSVVAVTDDNGDDVVVYKLAPGTGAVDWSVTIEGANPGSHRSVEVSDDGSTIGVLVTEIGTPNRARLYLFDASSSTPLGTFPGPDGSFGRNLSMSADGRFTAFMAAATVVVVDRDALAERFSASAGATNDAVAISGDGNVLAYGWSSMFVRTWNGSTYASSWSTAGPTSFLSRCAISADSSTLVAAWYPGSFDSNVIELYDLPSSTPAWTSTYAVGSGGFQDIVVDLALTADGSHVAVASWGDQGNTNKEVQVFEHASSSAVLQVDTPGSMFDVDIAHVGGAVHVTACGKHVHANQSGRGGDMYSIRIGGGACPSDVTGDGVVNVFDLLAVLDAWGPYGGCPPFIPEDINEDCAVNVFDLLLVLDEWGPCP